jgi:hypothetical protein
LDQANLLATARPTETAGFRWAPLNAATLKTATLKTATKTAIPPAPGDDDPACPVALGPAEDNVRDHGVAEQDKESRAD